MIKEIIDGRGVCGVEGVGGTDVQRRCIGTTFSPSDLDIGACTFLDGMKTDTKFYK